MLSREEKIEAYSWVIADLTKDIQEGTGLTGICWGLTSFTGSVLNIGYVKYEELPRYFPEVFANRGHRNTHWFPLTPEGHQKRIELLKEIIETLEKQC
jgi:hypothetical protein